MSDMSALEPLLDLQVFFLQIQKDILDDLNRQKEFWLISHFGEKYSSYMKSHNETFSKKLAEKYENYSKYLHWGRHIYQTSDGVVTMLMEVDLTAFVIKGDGW